MKVGDLVTCVCRGPYVTGIIVEIAECDLRSTVFPRDIAVMTDVGLEWWEEDELELVQCKTGQSVVE